MRQAVYGIREYNCLADNAETVFTVDISPDSETIATTSQDRSIKLWQGDGTLLKTLFGNARAIWQVIFNPLLN